MTTAAFQKIEKLSLRVRLVSPEGRQIAQVGSLARWNRVDSRPSLKDRVLRLRIGPHLGPFRSVRKLLRILLCVFPGHPWMRGLSEYLSRLPEKSDVSLVARLGWTLVHSGALDLSRFPGS